METTDFRYHSEDGVVENLFIFALIAISIMTMSALAVFVVQGQRYQAGLDLATHTAVRDIVASGNLENPTQLAQSDLTTTFKNMGLDLRNTSVSVNSVGGRCGSIAVSASKTLHFLWRNAIAINLSSNQNEPNDPLSSGMGGVAICIGS